jgi:hypothetical protein
MLKPTADIFKRTVRRGGMEELADDEPVLDPATELRKKFCEHGVLLRECADPACRESAGMYTYCVFTSLCGK